MNSIASSLILALKSVERTRKKASATGELPAAKPRDASSVGAIRSFCWLLGLLADGLTGTPTVPFCPFFFFLVNVAAKHFTVARGYFPENGNDQKIGE